MGEQPFYTVAHNQWYETNCIYSTLYLASLQVNFCTFMKTTKTIGLLLYLLEKNTVLFTAYHAHTESQVLAEKAKT